MGVAHGEWMRNWVADIKLIRDDGWAFNQKWPSNSGLLYYCEHFVYLRLQLYCPGIIDTHISGLWTQRGQGRSAAAVQSQTVQWHWRLFPHLGCTSQSALWRTGRLLVQILPLFNFHFLKFLAIFLPFDSALLLQKWWRNKVLVLFPSATNCH